MIICTGDLVFRIVNTKVVMEAMGVDEIALGEHLERSENNSI